jgi:peptidoglycan/xylan/chitin deacetylase (PgdA/CDA1 family)
LQDDAIAVTFDDGYACTADTAAPLLENLGIPATIFLPVELIEREKPFWWDELESLVLNTERESLRVGEDAVALGRRNGADGSWRPGAPPGTARQLAFHRLWAVLRTLTPAELDGAMTGLRTQASTEAATRAHPMSPEQVRRTASKVIAFGSHALSHPWLMALPTSEKSREILDSMSRCQALTGNRPEAFAYPYGNFDDESERLVKEAGFACACATTPSAVTAKSSLFALPRIQVGNWTLSTFGRVLGSRRSKDARSRDAAQR